MWIVRVLEGTFLLSLVRVARGYYSYSKVCVGCNNCTARPCRRRLGLIEYLKHAEYATTADARKTTVNSLGTCSRSDGSTSAQRCDLAFACAENECCGIGPDEFTPGWCAAANTCTDELWACNVLLPVAHKVTLSVVDPISLKIKVQDNSKSCGLDDNGIRNRNNGRCKSAQLCCTAEGACLHSSSPECYFESQSWAWRGGGRGILGLWLFQSEGSGYLHCGSGVFGNGLCYGKEKLCCSPNGYCGTDGRDPYHQPFCAGDTSFCLNCTNGKPSSGRTEDCEACESCSEGYAFSTTGNCVAITVSTCPAGDYITAIILRSQYFVDAIVSFECSGGSVIVLEAGGSGGTQLTVNSADGYCQATSGLYAGYVTQLSLQECTSGGKAGPYGALGVAVACSDPFSQTSCSESGFKATGIKTGFGSTSNTAVYFLTHFDFVYGIPATIAPTAAAVTYQCSSGAVIDTITLRWGTGLNAISSYSCKDSYGNYKTKTVDVGDSSAGTSVTVTGPFSAFSSGYAVAPDPTDAASRVSFIRMDGSKVPKSSLAPYGTVYTAILPHSCPTGQVIYGFSLAPDSSGTMVGGHMTARCRDSLTVTPTAVPTTTTVKPTFVPSTLSPTTPKPSTVSPTTRKPSTVKPSTVSPTTPKPSTATAKPSTAHPSTAKPTTVKPSTALPTTVKPTFVPSTSSPTTVKPSTAHPSTPKPSTPFPTAVQPNTIAPTPAQADAVTYQCSTGAVIDTITLRWGTGLNAISSYSCKDSYGNYKTKTVGVGDSSAGTSVTVTGPFSAFSSGYAVAPDPTDAASGVSFIRVDGSKVPKSSLPPYGTVYTAILTHSCATGQVIYGFSLAPDSFGTMVGGHMTARCRAT